MRMRSLLAILVLGLFAIPWGCAKEDKPPDVFRIATEAFPNGQQGVAYSHTAVAENGATPYSWAVTAGSLPAGLSLDAGAGTVSGTPTAVGVTDFTLSATDAEGRTDQKPFSITVDSPPLQITTKQLPFALQSAPYNFVLQRSGGGPSVVWTVVSGSPPTLIQLDPGTGTLTGVPPSGATPSTFVVQADDGVTTDTQRLAIEMDPQGTAFLTVRQDGSGGAHTSIGAAVASLPNPVTGVTVIEIDDDATYVENLTLLFTGSSWVSLRSAYNRLPTIQAAVSSVPTVLIQCPHWEIRGVRITGASAAAGVQVADTVSGVPAVYLVNCLIDGNQTAVQSPVASGLNIFNCTCVASTGIVANSNPTIFNTIVSVTGAFAVQSLSLTANFNVYYAPSGAVGHDGTNPYVTLSAWQTAMGQDANSIASNPLFTNAAGGDYSLQPGSPGIGTGTSGSGMPVTDIGGYARGTGSGWDIGAYEERP